MARTEGTAPRRRRADAPRSACPVGCALDVVGDRWTLLVVRDLFRGKTRFGEFLASSERITSNVLAERLDRLERWGLVSAVPYSQHPLRVEYRLTPRGRALGPVVRAIADWGRAQFPATRDAPDLPVEDAPGDGSEGTERR
jgi:DNA-binding HxlR family transcriptional regulator